MSKFTKTAIMQTFIRLLNQYPMDKITVKDIVDECGINRKTFYYYFQDIYDLLEAVIAEQQQEIRNRKVNLDSAESMLYEATCFISQNRKAVLHMLQNGRQELMFEYLRQSIQKNISAFVEKEAMGSSCSEQDRNMITLLYTDAVCGAFLRWIKAGMQEASEELISKLCRLLGGTIRFAVWNQPNE